MTDEIEAIGQAVQDAYDGFNSMEIARIGWHEYRVLSARNDDITHHRVDVREGKCDCRDAQMNQGDAGACAHLAKALMVHPSRMSDTEIAASDMQNTIAQVREIEDDLRNIVEVTQRARQADLSAEASDEGNGSSQESAAPDTRLLDALESEAGVPREKVDAWVHEDYGSLNFKANNMDDGEFSDFKSWVDKHDLVKWDKRDGCNYIQQDDIDKVL